MSRSIITAGNTLKSSRRKAVGALVLGMAISPLLVSSAQAQVSSDWTGATSTDWNDPTNWSNGFPNGAFPSGIATVNTSTGNIATITADSAFTPSDINIGIGAGNTGRVDHRAGQLNGGAGNWAFIGVNGGTGTYNLANTATTGGTLT